MGLAVRRKRRKRNSGLENADVASHTVDLADFWQRERPDLDHTELLLQIYVMRLGRMIDDAYDRMCRKTYGISGGEMRVLFALRRAGPPFALRPTDLFRALLVTSGAITKQVDRLQTAGLVVRLPDPSFGRGFLIQLTDKGRAAADETVEVLAKRSLISWATKGLSRRELEVALGFCKRLLMALEEEATAEQS
jgi:DNA-binding MarR family transcriptional regulator